MYVEPRDFLIGFMSSASRLRRTIVASTSSLALGRTPEAQAASGFETNHRGAPTLAFWQPHSQRANRNKPIVVQGLKMMQPAWASAIGTTNPHMVAKALTKGFKIASLKQMTKPNQQIQHKKY